MNERIDPDRVFCSDPDFDAESFADMDQKIRSGLCPNGCGLMQEWIQGGQECKACGFFCNTMPERADQ